MTNPKTVTDADTVARLAKAAKAIARALVDGAEIILVEPEGGGAMVACIGERYPDRSIVAVAIEGGDVWHYDTDTGTPQAAPVDVHVGCGDGCEWCVA